MNQSMAQLAVNSNLGLDLRAEQSSTYTPDFSVNCALRCFLVRRQQMKALSPTKTSQIVALVGIVDRTFAHSGVPAVLY
jgi:hypothetical protein